MQKTQLFIETHYGMNGAFIDIKDLVKKAVEEKYSSLAIADHRMYGAVSFYKECKKQGIKPIIGLRIQTEGIHENATNQFLLYAKDNGGYKNLLKLASFYAQRLVTLSELKQYKQGIIAVGLSDYTEIMSAFLNSQKHLIFEWISFVKEHFETIYLSISKNHEFNQYMDDYIKFVVTPHIRYLQKEDYKVTKVLEDIFQVKDSSLLGQEQSFHFPSQDEMTSRYSNNQDALDNTNLLAEECNVELDFDTTHLPSYPLEPHVTAKEYLHALAHKGLEKRLLHSKKPIAEYRKRLEYELSIINQMGYNDYFLIVWDFVKYAKQHKYLVGPGRGSAAASLVSYCLGITSVDSVEFDLVFERFLNPERITLPDIDMDLPDDKRDDIIMYVRDKYGMSKVSSICTFGTFQKRSAIRDTARILGVEGVLLNQILKESNHYTSIVSMMEESSIIHNIMNQEPKAKDVIEIASKIEGLNRHVSTHAAGIIITEDDMTNHTPVQLGLLDMFQTQYEAKDLEQLGLLKIDFLGLRNLSSITKIVDLIEQEENIQLDVYKIPLDDKKTFDLLKRVETTGLFQLESKGMRKLISDMQIDTFEDIVTILALYRPGPMDNIPTYLKRRNKEEVVSYPDPILKDILEPTKGIIVYQEQIIQIANRYAGYSLGEADLLRRAVSKKQEDVLAQEREHFIQKARSQNRQDKTSNEIYDYIVKFANYGFNRAHSVAYAMVSYWMAYLKANYPKYFISVLTSSVIGSETHMKEYIFEANKLGVFIMKPSINYSTTIFHPDGNNLLYPLLGIKNVGVSSIQEILEERKNGLFISYVDFVKRMNGKVNKRVIESLIYAGALDEFQHTKRSMIEQLDDVINFTLYGDFIAQDAFVLKDLSEYPYETLQAQEKTILGFNLFVNPLNPHRDYIAKHQLLLPSTVSDEMIDTEIKVVGMLQSIRAIKTKTNKDMAFITLQDEYSMLSGVLFTNTYNRYKDLFVKGNVYLVKGKLEQRAKEQQIVITHVHSLS